MQLPTTSGRSRPLSQTSPNMTTVDEGSPRRRGLIVTRAVCGVLALISVAALVLVARVNRLGAEPEQRVASAQESEPEGVPEIEAVEGEGGGAAAEGEGDIEGAAIADERDHEPVARVRSMEPSAPQVVAEWTARLSDRDHRNTKDTVLVRPWQVIRQDRFYVHSGQHVDPEDTKDTRFGSPEAREDLEALLREAREWGPDDKDVEEIVLHTPLIRVRVFENDRVIVEILQRESEVPIKIVARTPVVAAAKHQDRAAQRQERQVAVLEDELAILKRTLQQAKQDRLTRLVQSKGWDKKQPTEPGDVSQYVEWLQLREALEGPPPGVEPPGEGHSPAPEAPPEDR